MKADTVRVDGRAAGPVGKAAVDSVERLEAMCSRGLIDDRAKIAGMEAPFAGDRALLVRRQAFDLPRRQEQIRKRKRRTAENTAEHPGPAFRSIEVDDMRELVGEDQS